VPCVMMPAPLPPLICPPRIVTGVGSPCTFIVPVKLHDDCARFPLTVGLLDAPATPNELHGPVKLPSTATVSTHLITLEVSFLNALPASGKALTFTVPVLVEFWPVLVKDYLSCL